MFRKKVLKIALPVTLQSLLQSSFSVIDQVMIGQLGGKSIAGIGLGGKFASLYSIVLASVASAAGIMISQYMGKKDDKLVSRSFFVSLVLSAAVAAVFLIICVDCPDTAPSSVCNWRGWWASGSDCRSPSCTVPRSRQSGYSHGWQWSHS